MEVVSLGPSSQVLIGIEIIDCLRPLSSERPNSHKRLALWKFNEEMIPTLTLRGGSR